MRKILFLGLLVVMLCIVAAPVHAVSFSDGGAALQGTLDGITTAPVAGSSSVNVLTDQLTDAEDSYWAISGSGGSIDTIVVNLTLPSFTPVDGFGIFDRDNPGVSVELMDPEDPVGTQVTMSIALDGSVFVDGVDSGVDFTGNAFGYYVQYDGGWYSSDSSRNAGNSDHMVGFQGPNTDTIQIGPWAPGIWGSNEYIFGWELGGVDSQGAPIIDYNDFVVIAESINPVPEPASLALLGLGLIGLVAHRSRKH